MGENKESETYNIKEMKLSVINIEDAKETKKLNSIINVEGRVFAKTKILLSNNQTQYFHFALCDKSGECKVFAHKRMVKFHEQIVDNSIIQISNVRTTNNSNAFCLHLTGLTEIVSIANNNPEFFIPFNFKTINQIMQKSVGDSIDVVCAIISIKNHEKKLSMLLLDPDCLVLKASVFGSCIELFSESSVNKVVLIKNAKLHFYNNEKSINIGENSFIEFQIEKHNNGDIQRVYTWFTGLSSSAINIFLPANDKLTILSLNEALKLKLTRKPEVFKFKSELTCSSKIPYPVCEQSSCRGKKLSFNENNNEYYCSNVTTNGNCLFKTTTPTYNNRLEVHLIDNGVTQITATAIGKIADSLFEKIRTHKTFVLTVKAQITEFQNRENFLIISYEALNLVKPNSTQMKRNFSSISVEEDSTDDHKKAKLENDE